MTFWELNRAIWLKSYTTVMLTLKIWSRSRYFWMISAMKHQYGNPMCHSGQHIIHVSGPVVPQVSKHDSPYVTRPREMWVAVI